MTRCIRYFDKISEEYVGMLSKFFKIIYYQILLLRLGIMLVKKLSRLMIMQQIR